MAILHGFLRMISDMSLMFLVIYVFWIIKNFLVVWKRKFFGEESEIMVWNPFKLALDEEVYGPAVTNWIRVLIVIGLIYKTFEVINLLNKQIG